MSTIFWVWMAAAVVFLILELVSPTLFFICFVAGGVVAGIYSYFSPDQYYWQLGIFVIITLGLLPLTRAIAKKITKPEPHKSNVDGLMGKVALVTKTIDPDLGGQIKCEGEVWIAQSDQKIEINQKVRIKGVSGARLYVEPLQEKG